MTDKTELQELKDRADLMGIPYSPNIGVDTLRKKINEQLEGTSEVATPAPSVTTKRKVQQKATRLLRVRVTCLNANKKEAQGEYFSFANDVTGTIKRMVPFDRETHVEEALVNLIKNRKYARVTMVKGSKVPTRKMVNEFQVEVLPALTEKELKDLAADQAKRNAIEA